MMGDLTSVERAKGRRALRRTMMLGRLILLFALISSAALLAFTVRSVDQLQANEERLQVQRTLDRFEDRVVSNITSVSVWDQAYEIFQPGGNLAWADAEIGTYFENNRHHDVTLAIDRQNRPFYAWMGEARRDPNSLVGFEASAQPLIADVRAQERSGKPTPQLDPTNPGLANTAKGLIRWNGDYYLVGVSNVVPEHANDPRRAGPNVILISAQKVDHLLTELNTNLRLGDAQFLTARRARDNTIPTLPRLSDPSRR